MKKLLSILCIFFAAATIAQDTSAIPSGIFIPEINTPVQPLKNYLWLLQDKDGKMQIADFLQNKVSETAFQKAAAVLNADPFSVWWCF
jgi:hypothetical protein